MFVLSPSKPRSGGFPEVYFIYQNSDFFVALLDPANQDDSQSGDTVAARSQSWQMPTLERLFRSVCLMHIGTCALVAHS